MRVKTFFRVLRVISAIVLFFFVWTFGPIWQAVAFAATKEMRNMERVPHGGIASVQKPEERFEKALEEIREKVGKAGEKAARDEDETAEVAEVKAKRSEIEALDVELKKEFDATEEKLKDAKLPKEILNRHYAFVKNYEENLAQLKAEIDDIDRAKTKPDRKTKINKVREHLEKTKPPKKHVPLDPNKLPFRTVKAKERAPRLKKEEFERDFPPQKRNRLAADQRRLTLIEDAKAVGRKDAQEAQEFSRELPPIFTNGFQKKANRQKPVLVASNGPLTGLLSSNPQPETLAVPSSVNSVANDFIPQFAIQDSRLTAFSDPILNFESGILNLAAADVDLPTAADLMETPEVQFTDDVKNLAAQLNNSPVKIFEWVRNNIEYAPTYGSIQGADMCLQSKQCNGIDTASLLIALLRVSNIPAHYVYGTIEFPIEKVMNWVGGFTDAKAALTLMASGGIPVAAGFSGGTISKARFEHAWVEAYIPYGNYRGAIMDQSIKTWIPMDGSYKQYAYTNGFDITATVPFNQDEYLSQVRSQNAVHYYQSKIQEYLDANMPDTSIVDVKGYREITQETYHFLPSTLPYITVAQLGKFSSIPDGMKAKVTFTLSDPQTGSAVSYTASTAELAGKRLTVSYIPATSNDEALINNYGGYIYGVPAYMLNLIPVLKIQGDIKLSGETTTMGSDQTLIIQFKQPAENLNESVQKRIVVGTYYAIGLDLQGTNENVVGKRNNTLTANALTESAGTLGKDEFIGEYLYVRGLMYFFSNDKIYKSGARLYNTAITRTISEAITSFPLTLSQIFGITKSASPAGVEIDVPMDRIIAVSRSGDVDKEKTYMDIAGLVSSYHEHSLFENIDGYASVSAVRALQIASVNGIPIQRINSSNIGQLLPLLQVASEIKNDIQNAINAEKEVTISQTNVRINDWLGVGYIVKDMNTGSGAYIISGGIAGGSSTSNATGQQVAQAFISVVAWVIDVLSYALGGTIAEAAELNIGEKIVETAQVIDASTMGYQDVGQCSGLVRVAYWSAGICLDNTAPPVGFRCSNSLMEKHRITTGTGGAIGGAARHHALADHIKFNKSVRITNDPWVGDIVFFSNTTGPNHPYNHEGIVVSLPDKEGKVRFIHGTSKGGIYAANLNVSRPGDMAPQNNVIGCFCGQNCKCNGNDCIPCLAGKLFVGFGTIRDVSCNDSSHH